MKSKDSSFRLYQQAYRRTNAPPIKKMTKIQLFELLSAAVADVFSKHMDWQHLKPMIDSSLRCLSSGGAYILQKKPDPNGGPYSFYFVSFCRAINVAAKEINPEAKIGFWFQPGFFKWVLPESQRRFVEMRSEIYRVADGSKAFIRANRYSSAFERV